MSVIRHPAACQVCQSNLNGSAEIALERGGEEYYVNVSQSAPMDWGICPGCKQIACFAACWDAQRGYCKTCPSFETEGDCPKCGKALTGAIEITQRETFGIPTIHFGETTDRNWIQCDGCNTVVCKACCQEPKTGFCNRCLSRLKESESKTAACPVVAQFESYRLSETVNNNQNKHTNQSGGLVK